MKKRSLYFFKFLKNKFELRSDIADEKDMYDNIYNAVELKGTKLWVLIFAIIIASIGLNTNSTAVIIGAMLISPLMGPIIGFGFALSTYNFELVKKSARSFFFGLTISLIISTLYFFISPLTEAHSEILARTTPSIWDVIIALSGGLAGMIASTRKLGSNVIPGVAIATALMPPICTAGYGIATLQTNIFIGAFYLFFINSIFIALGSIIIVRLLKLQVAQFPDQKTNKKIDRFIATTIVITVIPCLFLAYQIVQAEILDQKIKNFINKEIKTEGGIVLEKHLTKENGKNILKIITLFPLSKDKDIADLSSKLKNHGLEKIKLEIVNYNSDKDISEIKEEVMMELNQKYNMNSIAALQKQRLANQSKDELEDIEKELKIQINNIVYVRLGFNDLKSENDHVKQKILLVNIKTKKKLTFAKEIVIKDWLLIRSKSDDIKIVWE